MENASLSAIVEVCEDMWTKIHSVFWAADEARKTEAKKELVEKHLPVMLTKLEAQAVRNNSSEGWIASDKVCSSSVKIL